MTERTCAEIERVPSTLPPRIPLREGATREEVLAYLELEDRRWAEEIEHTFPPVPRDHEGCVSCHCGRVLALYGSVNEDPVLARQEVAGEEDQSVPGWDFGL